MLVNLLLEDTTLGVQGTKLTFFSRRHLAPKFSKVVAKSKKLVANFFFSETTTTKKLYEKCIIQSLVESDTM